MASQGAKHTCLKWKTAKNSVQTSIKVATHSEVDTNNRSSSWNLPKSLHNYHLRSKEFGDEEASWFAAIFANVAIPSRVNSIKLPRGRR